MKDYSVDQKFTVTSEDKKRSKEYTVSVTFLLNRITLSFKKGDKEFPNLTTFNSKDKVKVTVSASGIPDALEGRVEVKLAQDTSQIPTVSKPTKDKPKLETDDITLPVNTSLYSIKAKLFLRSSGTSNEWVVAKTEHRQYARYHFEDHVVGGDILEITYDKFIVAKGEDVTLKIKKKDNDMSSYKRIQFDLEIKPIHWKAAFFINMNDKNLVDKNLAEAQNKFTSVAGGYTEGKFWITLRGLKKDTPLKFSLISSRDEPPDIIFLPIIFVKPN